METGTDGPAVHGSPAVTPVAVDIDPEMLARLEALPDKTGGAPRKVPTPQQLEALRRFWLTKGHDDLARAIGTSENTARRWYREYVEGRP